MNQWEPAFLFIPSSNRGPVHGLVDFIPPILFFLLPLQRDAVVWIIGILLKCYYDEIRIFPFVAVLKYQQELFMRRKMPFTVFQYLFSLQRYLRL